MLGLVAGAVCALAVGLKYKFGFDDSLDVVGVHFVGGWIGSLLHRLLRHAPAVSAPDAGRAHERPVLRRRLRRCSASRPSACGIVTVCSFVVALILGLVLQDDRAVRVTEEDEVDGIDVAVHAETRVRRSRRRRAAALAGGIGVTGRPDGRRRRANRRE